MKRFLIPFLALVVLALADVSVPVGLITINGGTGTDTATVESIVGKHASDSARTAAGDTAAALREEWETIVEDETTALVSGSDTGRAYVWDGDTNRYWGAPVVDPSPHIFGPYWSDAVYDTCATNENLAVDFLLGNNHKVNVGATLDTLTLTNGRDGMRCLVTLTGNAAATIVWKSDASAIWWPDSASPTRSGICNVYSFTYYLDVDEGTGGNQDVYIGAATTNFGPE